MYPALTFNVRRPGEHRGEEESFSAWALADRQQPLDCKLALVGWVPTDDPNAGKAPSDVFENVDPQTGLSGVLSIGTRRIRRGLSGRSR